MTRRTDDEDSIEAAMKELDIESRDITFSGADEHAGPSTTIVKGEPDWKKIDVLKCDISAVEVPDSVRDVRGALKVKLLGEGINVKIAPHPFDKGKTRLAYHGRVEYEKGTWTPVVMKLNMHMGYDKKKFCLERMQNTGVAMCLAKAWNRTDACKRYKSVEFIRENMAEVTTRTGRKVCYNIETFIKGAFKKYTNNHRHADSNATGLLHFAKWTAKVTESYLLVTDLQGVEDTKRWVLTDVAIVCKDKKRFGVTNLDCDEQMKTCLKVLDRALKSSSAPSSVVPSSAYMPSFLRPTRKKDRQLSEMLKLAVAKGDYKKVKMYLAFGADPVAFRDNKNVNFPTGPNGGTGTINVKNITLLMSTITRAMPEDVRRDAVRLDSSLRRLREEVGPRMNHVKTAMLLIAAMTPDELAIQSSDGGTALHAAAGVGCYLILELLLKKMNRRDYGKRASRGPISQTTALFMCVLPPYTPSFNRGGSIYRCVELLLKNMDVSQKQAEASVKGKRVTAGEHIALLTHMYRHTGRSEANRGNLLELFVRYTQLSENDMIQACMSKGLIMRRPMMGHPMMMGMGHPMMMGMGHPMMRRGW